MLHQIKPLKNANSVSHCSRSYQSVFLDKRRNAIS